LKYYRKGEEITLRLNQLEYLVALHKYGSILKASQNLYVSQPTISNAIKELEQELNCVLIERSNRGCIFSPKGLEVLESAVLITNELKVIQETSKLDAKTKKVLKIAVPTHLCIVLNRVVAELNKKLPDLICDLRIGSGAELIEQLSNRELDFAIVYIESLPQKSYDTAAKAGIVFETLFQDDLIIGCRPDHPLAGREVDVKEILNYPFAFLYTLTNSFTRDFLKANNYSGHITTISEPASIRKYACSSDALVPMSISTLKIGNTIYTDTLVPLKINGIDWKLTVSLVHWKEHSKTIAQIIKDTLNESEAVRY
jgi:Transcriptional regulator